MLINQRVLVDFIPNGGLGNSIMAYTPLYFLTQKYNVRLSCIDRLKPLFNIYKKNLNFELFTTSTEFPNYYTNDYFRYVPLIYWLVYGNYQPLPSHAINCMLKSAGFQIYDESSQLELPELDVPACHYDKMYNKVINKVKHPIILVHFIDTQFNKMMSNDRSYNIVDELLKFGTVIYIGKQDLYPARIHPKAINLIGKTSLAETLALINFADLVFCGDTFVQHAAALMKTPAVVYFCGTTPMDFGYPFFSNIFNPELVPCQLKCGYPINTGLYKYVADWKTVEDVRFRAWRFRCPFKFCEEYITPSLVSSLVDKELQIGKDRDWSFYPPSISNYFSFEYDYRQGWNLT